MLETSPTIENLGIYTNEKKAKEWKVQSSKTAKNCKNYIRGIVDNLNLEPNPEKNVIALSLGDPTIYGNLNPSKETIEATIRTLEEGSCNGYAPCVGYEKARQAVATYLSHDGAEFDSKDIILCSGCSSSLDLCISAIADGSKNHNILMPKPGFPIYRTLAESIGVGVKTYNLLPEKKWQVDLLHLESQIDDNTAIIILNNPSNPCGSVYDENHLRAILSIARRYQIPVIADEVYEQIVFPDKKFVSTAALESGVPILICGGLAKRFLIPGWRIGWIAVHDPINAFDDIRNALCSLSQKIIGSNTLIQGAIPDILLKTPQSFHDDMINTLCENAKVAYEAIDKVPGLVPYMPDGAMYMMVKVDLEKFPHFETGLQFIMRLMEEESVFCLPGDVIYSIVLFQCFELPGFMRIVITLPGDIMKEACDRIVNFCNKYYT
ncbi:tyrosine aminotransferase [Holotrichia oblita]|uniref:Tyrosine aminotransferase n=1 Tax=Holotrichia oblita TaxID=644536 RepID=A0ACB9TFN8_HOLOL|nr:tyrosine aminotransferase [Holotrichia oblita]